MPLELPPVSGARTEGSSSATPVLPRVQASRGGSVTDEEAAAIYGPAREPGRSRLNLPKSSAKKYLVGTRINRVDSRKPRMVQQLPLPKPSGDRISRGSITSVDSIGSSSSDAASRRSPVSIPSSSSWGSLGPTKSSHGMLLSDVDHHLATTSNKALKVTRELEVEEDMVQLEILELQQKQEELTKDITEMMSARTQGFPLPSTTVHPCPRLSTVPPVSVSPSAPGQDHELTYGHCVCLRQSQML